MATCRRKAMALAQTFLSQTKPRVFAVAVQHVTAEEAIFLRGKHPRIRSMPLSVFSFTLVGQITVPLPCREYPQGGGPFMSYLREDDDYQSLVRRLAAISGDSREEWWKMRLAIALQQPNAHRKTAVFLPQTKSASAKPVTEGVQEAPADASAEESKAATGMADSEEDEGPHTPVKGPCEAFIGPAPGPARTETAGTGAGAGAADAELDNESLWDIFSRHFPSHSHLGAATGLLGNRMSYPLLGIQRSVTDVTPKNRYACSEVISDPVVHLYLSLFFFFFCRSKRAGGGSIKIV